MKNTITTLAVLCGALINGQNFTLVEGTPFKGTSDGSVHLVDVEGDDDLDLFITGDQGGSGFQGIAEFYINDGAGNFTLKEGTSVTGVESASAAFGDVNDDGSQDLVLTGFSSEGRIAELWINDGSGTFTLNEFAPFSDVSVGDVNLVDIENDGDLDVLISGYNTASGRISEVYKNDGTGAFTLFTSSPAFDPVDEGDVDLADVNGDGYLDLVLTGDTGPSEFSGLFLNDGTGKFIKNTFASNVFLDLRDSDADIADVNGDGYPDVLINGRYESATREAELYTNDGTGNFQLERDTPFIGGNAGTVDFLDYDNDGDMDVLVCGYENSTPNRNTRLYSNDGFGNFKEETTETITGINNADIAIGDVDDNGFLDIIIVGYSNTRIAELYLNTGASLSHNGTELLEEFSIYPNPTKDFLQVSSKKYKVLDMQLYDLLGKVVPTTNKNLSRLNLSSLSPGVYMLKIDVGGNTIVKKIIKK
ncbi:T9SS type A sorting domain-containing protein [Aestuariivivens sediminicola]|uniref:T9SS type A sorting domain-containing protein n=1 Tax=Aestuariivivens sediminicola TaxID=2913560 RepID=UPI001F56AB64|nr:T9SS type A sorting domain-containing protein [Aestuariivivens sediminicola]